MHRVGELRERLHLGVAKLHVDVQQAELEVEVQLLDGNHVGREERHVDQLDAEFVGGIGGDVQQRVGERAFQHVVQRQHVGVGVVYHVQGTEEVHLAPVHELLADLDVEGVEAERGVRLPDQVVEIAQRKRVRRGGEAVSAILQVPDQLQKRGP